MSISSLNRSSFFAPLSGTSNARPASSSVRSVEGTPAAQPRNGLRQQLMTDSFEQGPSKLGNTFGFNKAAAGSGGLETAVTQMSQVLGELMQLLKTLGPQLQGAQGGAPEAQAAPAGAVAGTSSTAPAPQVAPASVEAPKAQSSAPAASPPSSPYSSARSTRVSDAGPGFGEPSAGSTQQASQPWLSRNNVGAPYNSNMLLISPSEKSQYKYTNTFTNKTDKPQTITLWNKTGEKGGPNDGQNFDKSTPKTFTLQPGQSQLVAFDTNSSVAWCVSKDGSAKPGANSGQTWGEATFANAATGWSGYDTSQIAPAGHSGNMSITNEATGVSVTQANAWQTPSDNPAGHDIGVPAGPLNLVTVFS